MDNTKKQFIDLLSNSMRNKVTNKLYENVDWGEILELAKKHKVEGLIYSAINKGKYKKYIDEDEYNTFKKQVFFIGVNQRNNIYKLAEIFKVFNKENIDLIVLKGLVVRSFYPAPEQRSMSDADIFVRTEDLAKAKNIIESFGYKAEKGEASHHIKYLNGNMPIIELHWNIIKRDSFTDQLNEFESDIWKNTRQINIGEAKVLSLGYADLTLHLFMHMAAHIASSGFGVRQICDLVLAVEQKGKEINWQEFNNKAKEYGFEKFIQIMFVIANKLFALEIPKAIDVSGVRNKENINELIDIIFNGGVYGRADMVNDFSNQLAFDLDKDNNRSTAVIKRYINFLFPRIEDMSDKYSYAKKCRILLPAAWVHHLFEGILSERYSAKEKIEFITKGAQKSVRKNKLLQWMEL